MLQHIFFCLGCARSKQNLVQALDSVFTKLHDKFHGISKFVIYFREFYKDTAFMIAYEYLQSCCFKFGSKLVFMEKKTSRKKHASVLIKKRKTYGFMDS